LLEISTVKDLAEGQEINVMFWHFKINHVLHPFLNVPTTVAPPPPPPKKMVKPKALCKTATAVLRCPKTQGRDWFGS